MRFLSRVRKIFILFACLTFVSVTSIIIAPNHALASAITAGDLNSLTNQQRAGSGLGALTINSQLTNAAYSKAQDMLADQYWAHVAPDGATPWSFIIASGYDYTTAGENLARGFGTSSGVVTAWMNSPEHRANLMNSSYREAGYAAVDGSLLGEQTTLVVAMYGSRSSANTAAQSQPTSTSASKTTSSSAPASGNQTSQKTNSSTPPTKTSSTAASGSAKKTSQNVAGATSSIGVSDNRSPLPTVIFIVAVEALFVAIRFCFDYKLRRNDKQPVWAKSRPYPAAALIAIAIIMVGLTGVAALF